ncbi:MAG: hypothetical protein MUP98_05255, partial [Candidatus Aminicenantes bacterium]|nr:hypothetical protein [Candidatus Aminicenantes bacterium]
QPQPALEMDKFDQIFVGSLLPIDFLSFKKIEEFLNVTNIRLTRIQREALFDRQILEKNLKGFSR